MDGYSVQEAASVLGVAEGRVWELLARGVLIGTPEGDSMRVFLKGQPGPIASAGTHDEPPRTNGNGGTHGSTGEASAFRELLTEFRNLTERYGQALLALGEARGEVAGLRSRVDQLEARLDLRLPPPVDAAPMAWDSLSVPASTPEQSPVIPPPPASRPPARRKPRRTKARTPREAVAGFADALARAQDPNAADLGEARGEKEAVAEAGVEPATEPPVLPDAPMQVAGEATDVAAEELAAEELAAEELAAEDLAGEEIPEDLGAEEIPDEPQAAEAPQSEPLAAEAPQSEPVAAAEVAAQEVAVEEEAVDEPAPEVEPPTYSAVVVEPDWFADGDFAWLDAAEMQGSEVEPAAVTPDQTEPEPETASAEASAEQVAQEEPEPEAQALQEPETPVEAVRQPEPEPPALFEAEAEFEPWQPPEPAAPETPVEAAVAEAAVVEPIVAEPTAADEPEPPSMSTAVAVEEVEEQVMWLGGRPESSPIVRDEPRPEYRAEADGWPAVDAAPVAEMVRPPLAMTEDELARLALDEGWDDAEVAAIRAMITTPPSSTVDLPGAAELHEAMAALEAVPVQADPSYDVSRQWAKPAADDNEPVRHDDWAFEPEPAAPPPATTTRSSSDVTSALRSSVEDPSWLRRRQGPAAAAYRRLRRLFPG